MSKIPVVVLAAGKASRLGVPKSLFKVQGKEWLNLQLLALGESKTLIPYVVLGDQAEEIIKTCGLKNYFINHNPEQGPFSSVQTALLKLKNIEGGVFILPVDVPAASPNIWEQMLKIRNDNDVVRVMYNDRGGHPVWLGPRIILEIQQCPVTDRLDILLRDPKWKTKVLEIEDDLEGVRVITNLNTPEDFKLYSESATQR